MWSSMVTLVDILLLSMQLEECGRMLTIGQYLNLMQL